MILDDLVIATEKRLASEKQQVSLAQMQKLADQAPRPAADFAQQLHTPGLHVIGELKQASPSKGQIVAEFPYAEIAREYTAAGIDAISILTEPTYFKGDIRYLRTVSQVTTVPLLRKDFTIDPYMIYEARANGASIILLIVAILTDDQLADYLALAASLGLSAIVEAHNAEEIQRAVTAGANIIGINNRNLKDFSVDFTNSIRLRHLIPESIAVIAESGIHHPQEAAVLQAAQFNGILVGEALMRSQNKAQLIHAFKEAANDESENLRTDDAV
ncbi:indole-3-glycerol phosphate synthase TrpC [Schleiferilactobacillus perolens]|uniref:Indole-3-glycerol phosphate synthase n=1 Tax=Schleiferilactobacillus perolens DSM 12744 TaxID=1423792 RepID=A0A0R1N4Y4_9LACO|nr:indole-3-glycerol phosphate synthase TrpC [Schleiferilactobacillus perolens]KRL14745.1 indole-3-glycerol-phosphate synthase [Schleiferilactobacillus perolens DSM 12744]